MTGRAALIATVSLWLLAGAARANIGAPSLPGDPAAEARGDFRSLEILREELRFDLRPLATAEPARVTVGYQIRNPGEGRTLAMAFVTPGIEKGSVELDGTPLRHRELPASQPATEAGGVQLVFEAALGARREHRIEVAYQMRPARDTTGSLYWKHGILYDLSPARQWGKFGALEVEVLAPAGWLVEADPVLERSGDRLYRRFQGLPAANLVLNASRAAEYTWGWILVLLGVLLGIGGGLALSWRVGRTGTGSTAGAMLRGLGCGLLGAVLPLLLAAGAFWFWSALLDSYQASGRAFYSYSLGLVFLGVPGGVLLLALNAVTYAVARRRAAASP